MRALLTVAWDRDADVVVPSVVLAELYRGDSTDAAVDTVLARRGMRTITSGRRIVRTAGALRHRDRLDSCHVAWSEPASIRRPRTFQARALPTELSDRGPDGI